MTNYWLKRGIKNLLARRSGQKGQALAEYLILTALIAVASIGVVQVLGTNLQRRLANISDAIRGGRSQHKEGVEVQEKHYQVRDLGDFDSAIDRSGNGNR